VPIGVHELLEFNTLTPYVIILASGLIKRRRMDFRNAVVSLLALRYTRNIRFLKDAI